MSPPVNWVEGGAALFAIGNAGGSSTLLTITMNSNHTVAGVFNGLTPGSCYLTINGTGIMTMPGTAAQGFDSAGSPLGQTTILAPIAGTAILEPEGGGSLFLFGTNTYTGGTLLGGTGGVNFNNNSSFGTGRITWSASTTILATPATDGNGHTGATGPITIANPVTTISGTQIFVAIAAAPTTFTGPWTLPSSGTTTFQSQPSGTTVTISGAIGGAAAFTKTGTGTLILNGANSYTGATTVTNSTLALGASGSINSSSTLTLAPGANGTVFDVSAIHSYTLGGSTTLVALGTGTAASTAANIKGASGGTVSLGSRPVILNFVPTAFTGDTAHPPLYISQGALTLNNNSITVTNAAATALGTGTYRLIQVGNGTSGSISGTPSATITVRGTGIATNLVAALVVSNGNLNLVVKPPSVFTNLTLSESNAFAVGPVSVTLSGRVGAGSVHPSIGETVAVTFNGSQHNVTTTDSSGDFSYTFNPQAIPYSASPYPAVFAYSGDASLGPATNTTMNIVPNSFYTNDDLPGFISGLNLFFTNTAGIAMYTWSTTNVGLPVTDWTLEGPMQEQPLNDGSGKSRYSINVTPASPLVYYISGPTLNWPYLSPTGVQWIATDDQGNYTYFSTNISINTAGFLSLPSAPVIVQQPNNQTVLQGKNASFNVTATGSKLLAFQWFFNTNTAVSVLTTNPVETLTAVTPDKAGVYTVLVTNQYGGVTSTNVTLTVVPPPQATTAMTTNGFQLTTTTIPGTSYLIQSTTNISPPVTWVTVASGNADSNGAIQFTDTNFAANLALYYQLAFP
jgi:autotransporter-associated beta strand protein